jgi:hypothetical protein
MGSEAQALWRWIETYLMKNTSGWNNNLDYGVTMNENHIDEFAKEKFGNYSQYVRFRIDKNNYKMKILPLQNKNTRSEKAYGSVKGGGENKVNILCFKVPENDGKTGFNLHIQVRRQATADRMAKRAANKKAEEEGGWQKA